MDNVDLPALVRMSGKWAVHRTGSKKKHEALKTGLTSAYTYWHWCLDTLEEFCNDLTQVHNQGTH